MSRKQSRLRDLFPGYFNFVMATGIVSIAAYYVEQLTISDLLLWIAIIGYVILITLFIVRIIFFPRAIGADLLNSSKSFLFLTFVAGTDVLGVRIFLAGYVEVAIWLWVVAVVFWTALIYSSFTMLLLRNRLSVGEAVNGGWFLAVVGTQSLVLLGSRVIPYIPVSRPIMLLLNFSAWAIGIVIYLIFITLVLYRLAFFEPELERTEPLQWIDMGAAAISAVGSVIMVQAIQPTDFLAPLVPIIATVSLVLWAWAAWLIPLIVVYVAGRHISTREGFHYYPSYWSMVFPLGMFTQACWQVGTMLAIEPLRDFAQIFFWVALGAWTLTAIGLAFSLRPSSKSIPVNTDRRNNQPRRKKRQLSH
jgi:tellurite resistance protein TehA-like permease